MSILSLDALALVRSEAPQHAGAETVRPGGTAGYAASSSFGPGHPKLASAHTPASGM